MTLLRANLSHLTPMAQLIMIDERKVREMMHPPFNPHPAQQDILKHRKNLTIIEAGRQFGKSLMVGYICVLELLKPNTHTWIVAPFANQTNIIWNYVYPTCSKYPETFRIRLDERKIECIQTGSILECRTAENPVALLGATLTGLIIDEAAEITQDVWEQRLEPTLTVKKGWCIMISTPLTEENWFHQLYIKARSGELTDASAFHFTSYDNPYQDKASLDKIRQRIPDYRFRQQYLAEAQHDSGLVFKQVDSVVFGELEPPKPGRNNYVLGWDPARERDYSVVVVIDRTNGHVVHFDRSTDVGWDTQQEKVLKIAKRYNNAKIIMDATGLGDPLLFSLQSKALRDRVPVYIEPFKISTNKIKVELIENLAIMIQEWSITFPDIPPLLHELKVFRYYESDAGNTRYDHPKGDHDDCVMALALAAWEQHHFPFKKGMESKSESQEYVKVY